MPTWMNQNETLLFAPYFHPLKEGIMFYRPYIKVLLTTADEIGVCKDIKISTSARNQIPAVPERPFRQRQKKA